MEPLCERRNWGTLGKDSRFAPQTRNGRKGCQCCIPVHQPLDFATTLRQLEDRYTNRLQAYDLKFASSFFADKDLEHVERRWFRMVCCPD
jgi:hypothetical protein